MTKRPAFQFYPSDWRQDMALQSCSMAAQGLWLNMLCLAHECSPYGFLVVNGKPMGAAHIARLLGLSARDCERLLAELHEAGVTSQTEDGAIFSRRMVRDEALRNARAEGGKYGAEHGHKGAEHGSKGGRPRKETGDKKPPLNPPPSSSSSSSNKDSLRSSSARDKRTPDDVTVPDWVPAVSWRAFVQHRKDIRKPLTANAAELAIAELEKLKAQGHEPAAVINQSIVSRWAGLFPLKGASHVKPAGTGNAGRSLSAPERVAAAIAERDAASGRTLEHGAAG